jgi:hypothetical protein
MDRVNQLLASNGEDYSPQDKASSWNTLFHDPAIDTQGFQPWPTLPPMPQRPARRLENDTTAWEGGDFPSHPSPFWLLMSLLGARSRRPGKLYADPGITGGRPYGDLGSADLSMREGTRRAATDYDVLSSRNYSRFMDSPFLNSTGARMNDETPLTEGERAYLEALARQQQKPNLIPNE